MCRCVDVSTPLFVRVCGSAVSVHPTPPSFKWLFQPETAPDKMPAEEAPALSAVLREPFHWEPCERSPLECHSVDGVLRVVDPGTGEDVFPLPGTATHFFTDMHR